MRALFLAALLLLAGCPLVHDDPTPNACLTDDDCFVGANEYCDRPNMDKDGVCRVRPTDARVVDRGPKPDQPPSPDLGLDLGPDGDLGPAPDGVEDAADDASGDLWPADQGGEP